MIPNLNPSRGFHTYTPSDADCTKSAKYNVPFFKDNLGPKFEEYGACSNLLRPGQHTQVKNTLVPPVLRFLVVNY